MAEREIKSDLNVEGKIKLTTVPNATGTLLTYNTTSKEISTRTNAEVVSDLSLMTTDTNQTITGQKIFWTIGGNGFNNHALRVQSQDGSNPGMTFYKGGVDIATLQFDGTNFKFRNSTDTLSKYVAALGFKKDGSDNSFFLLGGGEHIAASNYPTVVQADAKYVPFNNSPFNVNLNAKNINNAGIIESTALRNNSSTLQVKSFVLQNATVVSSLGIKLTTAGTSNLMGSFTVTMFGYTGQTISFRVSMYKFQNNWFSPSITWVHGDSSKISNIEFYKENDANLHMKVNFVTNFGSYNKTVITDVLATGGDPLHIPDTYTISINPDYSDTLVYTLQQTILNSQIVRDTLGDAPKTPIFLSTTDLNTILTPGFYNQTTDALATLARNYPATNAGSLNVYKSVGLGVIQEYTTYNSVLTYRRSYTSVSWTPWRLMTDSINGSNSFITSNTNQTGLTGDKTTSGHWTLNGTGTNSLTVLRPGSTINNTIAFGFDTPSMYVGLADSNTFTVGTSTALGGAGIVNRTFWVDNLGNGSFKGNLDVNGNINSSSGELTIQRLGGNRIRTSGINTILSGESSNGSLIFRPQGDAVGTNQILFNGNNTSQYTDNHNILLGTQTSTGSSIFHTSVANLLSGYGAWVGHNLQWDGTNFIQPRGSLHSWGFTANNHKGFSFNFGLSAGTNGGIVSLTEVLKIDNLGLITTLNHGNSSQWNSLYQANINNPFFRNNSIISQNVNTGQVTTLDTFLPNGGFISGYGTPTWGGTDAPVGASYGGFIKFGDNNGLHLYYNNGHGGSTGHRLWFRTKNSTVGTTDWAEIATGELMLENNTRPSTSVDLNTYKTQGFYAMSTFTNGPVNAGNYGNLLVTQSAGDRFMQLYFDQSSNNVYFRNGTGGTTVWGTWKIVSDRDWVTSQLANYVTQTSLNTQLVNYATLAGTQTFSGTNTFTQSPIVPTGTLISHAVNLGQMDDAIDTNASSILNYVASNYMGINQIASTTVLGGIKVGANLTIDGTGILSATDTNTTYTAGNGLTLTGTAFSLPITISGSGNYITDVAQNANGITVTKGTLPSYTLPLATSTITGGIRLITDTQNNVSPNAVTTTVSRSYAVQLNNLNQAVVNVPWTDTIYVHPTTSGNKHIPAGGSANQILRWSADGTAVWGAENNTTYTAGSGLTLTGTVFSLPVTVTGSGNYIVDVTQNTNGITVTKGTLPTYVTQASLTTQLATKINALDSATGLGFVGGTAVTPYVKHSGGTDIRLATETWSSTSFVSLSSPQSITAVKTFTVSPKVPFAVEPDDAVPFGQTEEIAQTRVNDTFVEVIYKNSATDLTFDFNDYPNVRLATITCKGTNFQNLRIENMPRSVSLKIINGSTTLNRTIYFDGGANVTSITNSTWIEFYRDQDSDLFRNDINGTVII